VSGGTAVLTEPVPGRRPASRRAALGGWGRVV